MLSLDGEAFTQGAASYLDRDPLRGELTAKIYIRVHAEGFDSEILAQLDTAAPWTILDTEVAKAIDLFSVEGPEVPLSARGGRYRGKLVKLPITLVASRGVSLDVDATIFNSEDWPWGTFIGCNGFLQSIRFAVDPSQSVFHFGTW